MTNLPVSTERNASFSDFSSLLAYLESPTEAMGVAKWVAAELGKLDCVLGLILIGGCRVGQERALPDHLRR